MKTVSVKVRITPQDLQQIDSCASQLQITRSELIRRYIDMGMNQKGSTKIIAWDSETISIIRNCNMLIAKIGININQIARACNTGNTNVSLATEVDLMKKILNYIQKVVSMANVSNNDS